MKLLRKIITTALLGAMALYLTACDTPATGEDDDGVFRIVTSFYPVQILTMNIAGGIDGVEVVCMSDPNLGCIHDHTFTTEDLRAVENADVYVENGLGLETFNDRVLASYPDLVIIEAAEDVTDAPSDDGEINGHVWTSLDDYMIMADHTAQSLAAADPDHAAQYEANAAAYIAKIEALQEEYAGVISGLSGLRVTVLDESLPSFCVYAGMDFMTLETDHEQSALSAGDLGAIIDYMNSNGVNAIFVGADTEADIADAVASETGAQIYVLNTCITGEVDANAYIAQMEENLEILSGIG